MILLGLLGAVALAAGLVLLEQRRRDVVARGEVVASRTTREGAPVLVNELTVAFRDPDGEDVRIAVRSRAAFGPGTAVTVRYRRGDVARARVEVFRPDVVLAVGGVLALTVAVLPAPAGFLAAVGGIFAAVGGYVLRPLVGGVRVRGTVVRVDRKVEDGSDLWRPVVRFFDREERERVVEYDVWTSGRGPQVGAPQILRYRPQDPARILLGTGTALGAIMAGTGGLLLVAAVVTLFAR